MKRIAAGELRNLIAGALATHLKAYNLPAFCTSLGLAPGENDEAFSSKQLYVKNRLLDLKEPDLLRVAAAILKEFDDAALADLVSEMTVHAEHRLTELTRRDVLKTLNYLDPLFGDIDIFEGLNIIAPEPLHNEGYDGEYGYIGSLSREVCQHYVRNSDLSNEQLLIKCGALTCSQTRFVALLEKLLDPVVRRGDDQLHLVGVLNGVLGADGFKAVEIGEQSSHPIYAVQRVGAGVIGGPKNLIFASVRTKPDLVFTDAINNDIAIRNETDALIYDRFLSDSGLLWITLAEWWQEREGPANLGDAKRALYKRLLRSVKQSSSPGEVALFETYYREFSQVLRNRLPALIPQVYLHYDFRTMRERGSHPALLRQRMDMLLLLDHNVRIVIEVDGKQHYADGNIASPAKYAEMVAEDRRLRLAGYELYRFGSVEFKDAVRAEGKYEIGPNARQTCIFFFERLFARHNVRMKS